MVRNSQPWELGEPELNDRGQPVIHNIAQKLGCIRPNSDIDLPVHSVFPEDEQGMHELALQLEEQQRIEDAVSTKDVPTTASSSSSSSRDTDSSSFQRTDRASSSELDHSDFEQDYRAAAFGGNNVMTMSPQSFTTNNTDFELGQAPPDLDPSVMFPSQSSPPVPNFPAWSIQPPTSKPHPHQQHNGMMHFMQATAPPPMHNLDLLGPEMQERLMNQGLVESDFGTLKPHVLSCANPEVMMGMGDPMIFAGAYEGEL